MINQAKNVDSAPFTMQAKNIDSAAFTSTLLIDTFFIVILICKWGSGHLVSGVGDFGLRFQKKKNLHPLSRHEKNWTRTPFQLIHQVLQTAAVVVWLINGKEVRSLPWGKCLNFAMKTCLQST